MPLGRGGNEDDDDKERAIVEHSEPRTQRDDVIFMKNKHRLRAPSTSIYLNLPHFKKYLPHLPQREVESEVGFHAVRARSIYSRHL